MSKEMLYYWNGVLLAVVFYFIGALVLWSEGSLFRSLFLVFSIMLIIFSYIAMHRRIGSMEDD